MSFEYTPKLTEREFDDYMASYHNLIRARRSGQLSQEDYEREKGSLNISLDSIVAPGDVRYFPRIDGLREFLQKIGPQEDVNKWTQHESEHGTKAEALGYTVQYGVWLMQGHSGNLVVVPFTHVIQESQSQHLDVIKGAASDQSAYDRQ